MERFDSLWRPLEGISRKTKKKILPNETFVLPLTLALVASDILLSMSSLLVKMGINLSGGQKQRVSLARALYQDRDIYLMDDPLSAVDVHVGRYIYDKVLGSTGYLHDKTRVLVTHGITHLPKADQIIVLKDGAISEMGSYNQLLDHDGAFAELMRTYLRDDGNDSVIPDEDVKDDLRRQLSNLSGGSDGEAQKALRKRKLSRSKSGGDIQKSIEGTNRDDKAKQREYGKKLIGDERTEVGGMQFSVLWGYFTSMGTTWPIIFTVGFLLNIASDLFSNIWLSEWSSDVPVNGTNALDLVGLRLGVYGAAGAGQVATVFLQSIALAICTTNACTILHECLLGNIMKTPMSFFDTTPIGRVLNRFASDMSVMDSTIKFTLQAIFRGLVSVTTMVVAISYSTPIFLTVIVPISIAYFFVQRFYIRTSNQLRRIVSIRTSPIYSHFGESVSGASSIRAYQLQEQFVQQSDRNVDRMQMANYASMVVVRWLNTWLEGFGAIVVFLAAVFAVISRDSISGGMVGLSITYALQVTDRLAFFLRNCCDLESNIVSTERIQEYSRVKTEAPWRIKSKRPPPNWPNEGIVTFSDYSTRYRPELDLVLKNISCNIKPREMVGIVGRTGAGKSSMTLGLFRIIEASSGSIRIDGTNTGLIGLHDLRSKLTIIPQDPVLFSGDLRSNLDPLELHSDQELWDSLEHAHLKEFVRSLTAQLRHECTEGGQNLSVGQRQLVCLARALLRKTKVLILDEATAAVDLETDNLIQTTIRSEFKDCTVLTIAHRINTILDYDRVMVLEEGTLVEFDAPAILMENQSSIFHSMCKEAGLVKSNGPSQTQEDK